MLSDWSSLDTWIVLTAMLAAVACALPGTFLLLRRQSLLGDALSHSVLPGIVLAYLAVAGLEQAGWLSSTAATAWRHPALFLGAACTAVLSGSLSELLTRVTRLDPGAALGVVYTSLFAAGLLLIRLAADTAHIDLGCVLYGNLETVVTDVWGGTQIPRATVVNALVLLANVLLLCLFFKELLLCTFDPGLARALGLPVTTIQQLLLVATGATVVAAFESVGSILVIAMLVVPPACGVLLSDRLTGVLTWAVVWAIVAAVLGHLLALVTPPMVRSLFQWPELGDISTAGMMAVVSGAGFLACWLLAPQHGVVRQWRDHRLLQQRILLEDILSALYRLEEMAPATARPSVNDLVAILRVRLHRLQSATRLLKSRGDLQIDAGSLALTATGRQQARQLVRSHRLWESYLAEHFRLPSPRLHASAEQVEHFLNPELREQLADELNQPGRDPHGTSIPPAGGD